MEYENTARGAWGFAKRFVLILVLMEYENTQLARRMGSTPLRLNPCSNGIRKYLYVYQDQKAMLS